jgi:simple sugar transport system permease protein
MNATWRQRLTTGIVAPLWAVLASAAISAFALIVSGHSPIDALEAMITFVDSTSSVVTILNRAAPLYVVSLGVAIGFKMNLFNIGADGQYRLAALFAAAVAAELHIARPINILITLIVAMAVGGAWAAIPGVLKVTRNVNEVVSTIMLNYIATGLGTYLFITYFKADIPNSNVAQTKTLKEELEGYLPIAIVVGIVVYFVLFRTRFGFDLRISGANPDAARASGVSPKGMIMKTIIISGALAGLASLGFLLTTFPKYDQGFPFGLAFTGIAVALLGRNHPIGVGVAALAWSTVEQAARGLLDAKIPQEISRILLGSLLYAALISFEVVRRRTLAKAITHASRVAPGTAAPLRGAT